jgi:hypothetical protein
MLGPSITPNDIRLPSAWGKCLPRGAALQQYALLRSANGMVRPSSCPRQRATLARGCYQMEHACPVAQPHGASNLYGAFFVKGAPRDLHTSNFLVRPGNPFPRHFGQSENSMRPLDSSAKYAALFAALAILAFALAAITAPVGAYDAEHYQKALR